MCPDSPVASRRQSPRGDLMDRDDEIRRIVTAGYLRESIHNIARAADCDVSVVERHIAQIVEESRRE